MVQLNYLWEEMWSTGRARALSRGIAAVITLLFGLLVTAGPAYATAFTVNSTDGRGTGGCNAKECTLREAITAANGNKNPTQTDTIAFSISGNGPHTINITSTSVLPTITQAVAIDGYTQGDSTPGTTADDAVENTSPPEGSTNAVLKIELNGANAGSNANGLTITAANSTIKGLIINRFNGRGILVQGAGATNNRIAGNYIGTNASGTQSMGNFGAGVSINGAPNNTIGGIQPAQRNVISGSGGSGVSLSGAGASGNKVEGNYIGTNAAGTQGLLNQQGVVVSGDASNNTIGGTVSGARNIVSGNLNGVFLASSFTGPTTNKVEGNYIGTDASGTQPIGNVYDGVNIHGDNNTIGGTVSGARNLISGNGRDGVDIQFGASGNKVQGNYIGTDASGTQALGNSQDGAQIETGADNNTIGGTVSGARNVISGNNGVGVKLSLRDPGAFDYGYGGATDNKVEGNYIGTDVSGTQALGNSTGGVRVENASDNIIGGTLSGARNVISGNGGAGVSFNASGTTGNKLEGNYVGTDVSGTQGVGNSGGGVRIDGAPNNTIGGATPEAANSIRFNGGVGVWILSGTGNRVLSNSISSNDKPSTPQSELGIDLGTTTGVTANDDDDRDTGANNLQNYPRLLTATTEGTTTTITGWLESRPNQRFTIQFFSSAQADPSGFGEGEEFLGQKADVTTDASGNASFSFTIDRDLQGKYVTATTTFDGVLSGGTALEGGGTSEFSRVEQVTQGPPAPEGPTISNIADQTIEQDTNTGPIPFTVGDADTPEANLTVSGTSSNTTLVPDANIAFGGGGESRTVTVTPAAGEVGTANITVKVSDGTAEATETFVLTVQDILAPSLRSVSPTAGATGVSPTAKVGATFWEDMDSDSISDQTFMLLTQDSTPVAATVSYDEATMTATLEPGSSLVANSSYTATVKGGSTGVKDLSGKALQQDYSWSFTTGSTQ